MYRKTMKPISLMTSAEIAQHRSLLGKVYFVTVQYKSQISDIEEFSQERAFETVGQTYPFFPRIIEHGWREVSA